MITTPAPTTAVDTAAERVPARPIWAAGTKAGLVAAVAATAVAGAALAAGVDIVDADGKEFPLFGFAQVTLMCVVVGLALATAIARRASHPARTWVRTSVALTVVSCVPSLLVAGDAGTAVTLVLTHVVAAVVVIPVVARTLAR